MDEWARQHYNTIGKKMNLYVFSLQTTLTEQVSKSECDLVHVCLTGLTEQGGLSCWIV